MQPPGRARRSPGSLQRQTNARLGRHRLRQQLQLYQQLERPELLWIEPELHQQPHQPHQPGPSRPQQQLSHNHSQGHTQGCFGAAGCLLGQLGAASQTYKVNRWPPAQASGPKQQQQQRAANKHQAAPKPIKLQMAGPNSPSGSTASLDEFPFCKICHLGASKGADKLIAPCKCAGTMQFIHCGCLLKWLQISNKTSERPMACELCGHQYTWHKRFNSWARLQWPRCSSRDALLHALFVLSLCCMLAAAMAPVLRPGQPSTSGQQALAPEVAAAATSARPAQAQGYPVRWPAGMSSGRHQGAPAASSQLAGDEKFMLLCAAGFFLAFFLAVYTQTKARDTLSRLVAKFLHLNRTYYITEYDHSSQPGQPSKELPPAAPARARRDRDYAQQQQQQQQQRQQTSGPTAANQQQVCEHLLQPATQSPATENSPGPRQQALPPSPGEQSRSQRHLAAARATKLATKA